MTTGISPSMQQAPDLEQAPDRPQAALRDVTLRDGLQLTGGLLPVDEKVALVRTLLDAGVPQLEIGSMARPDLVPPMANTLSTSTAPTRVAPI